MQTSNVERYLLSSYHKSLRYLNFFSTNSEAAQDFRDEVDIKEAKSFFWIKEHAP